MPAKDGLPTREEIIEKDGVFAPRRTIDSGGVTIENKPTKRTLVHYHGTRTGIDCQIVCDVYGAAENNKLDYMVVIVCPKCYADGRISQVDGNPEEQLMIRQDNKKFHIDPDTNKLTVEGTIKCTNGSRFHPCGWHVRITDGVASDV